MSYYLRWVREHRDATRFLFRYGDLEQRGRPDEALARLNGGFFAAIHAWAVDVGVMELARLPIDVAVATWLGPCHQYARRWVSGATTTPIDEAAALLADAAWAALSSVAGTNHQEVSS